MTHGSNQEGFSWKLTGHKDYPISKRAKCRSVPLGVPATADSTATENTFVAVVSVVFVAEATGEPSLGPVSREKRAQSRRGSAGLGGT